MNELEQSEHPIDIARYDGDLAERTDKAVRATLAQRGTKPSEAHFAGMLEIGKVIQGMASGILKTATYLSSLPTGIGKTTTVEQAVKSLLSMCEYDGKGVIIFLAQVDFINAMLDNMKLRGDEFSVIVSRRYWTKLKSLGNPSPQKARVLFTTQAQLDSQLKKGAGLFRDIKDFWFEGKPREIRIWDEACSPSTELTVNRADLLATIKAFLKDRKPEVAGALDDLSFQLKQIKKGTKPRIKIPELEELGIAYKEGLSLFKSDEDQRTWTNLWEMQGKITIGTYEEGGNTVLTYTTWMPKDMNPLLVLDASGKHNRVYPFWAKGRGGLHFLPSPQKDYEPLKIKFWDRGSGRETWRKDKRAFSEIADAIAKEINHKIPSYEPVLVIHYLPNGRIKDLSEAIRERSDPKRVGDVHFLTWGSHTATNEFRDCKYVFLASPYDYPPSVHRATAIGAHGMDIETEDLTEEDFWDTREGAIAYNIYQAACRGAIRKAVDSSCPPGCVLYVIFSTKKDTGIQTTILNRVFPKAKVEDWYPFIKLSDNHQGLVDYIASEIVPMAKTTKEIRKGDIAERFGFARTNWARWLTEKVRLYLEQEHNVTVNEIGKGMVRFINHKQPRDEEEHSIEISDPITVPWERTRMTRIQEGARL